MLDESVQQWLLDARTVAPTDSARMLVQVAGVVLVSLGQNEEHVVQDYCAAPSCFRKVGNCSHNQGAIRKAFLGAAEIGDHSASVPVILRGEDLMTMATIEKLPVLEDSLTCDPNVLLMRQWCDVRLNVHPEVWHKTGSSEPQVERVAP